MSDTPKWSDEQLTAIRHTGSSLLVSAAAGSGKTATLSERCAYLVCDKEFCEANELLVVTFTEEAAGEMKSRVEKAIGQRLVKDPSSARVKRQLALLPGAQISTIHAFCARLLKQHFQAIELDPAFAVLDEQEAALLQQEVAGELLEDAFASGDAIFTSLVDLYADGKDARIEEQVIQTHNVLCSLTDPEGWRRKAMARLREVEEKPSLSGTTIGDELAALARNRIETLRRHADSVLAALASNPAATGCGEIVTSVCELLDGLLQVLPGDWSQARIMVQQWDSPTLRGAAPCTERDRAKELMETVRKPVKAGGEICELFSRDEAQMRAEIIQTIQPAECFLKLVGDFGKRYAEAKRRQNVVDFSDLEQLALKVLRDDAIAEGYQRRFASIMIDEFQDVNALQWELIERVARKDRKGEPINLFCVGDVKQSIYRFRLADPSIFMARERKWRPLGQIIDMRHNYRSRKPLLEAINFIFRDLMKKDAAELDYQKNQELDGKREFGPAEGCFTGAPIEMHLLAVPDRDMQDNHQDAEQSEEASEKEEEDDFSRITNEAQYTAQLISELMASGKQVTERDKTIRPLEYRDIAVLMRSAKFTIVEYAREIAARGIPVFAESRTGFFTASEINDMLSILRLLDNQQQDIPMAAALRSPIFGLPEPEKAMARIRIAYRDMPFHAAVVMYAREGKDQLQGRLKRILEQLATWRERSLLLSVADLLWGIMAETGYVEFCSALRAGAQRVANLMYLHRCARKFSGFRQQGLFRFLQYVQQLEERSDLGQPSPGEPGNAVRVMTIHGSKGLEFPVVILTGTNGKWNMSDCAGTILVNREQGLAVSVADRQNDIRYPSAANWLAKDRIRRASLAEELRVLYVAMTRAQEHLMVIGSYKGGELEKWEALPSPGADPVSFSKAGSALQWLVPLVKTSGGQLVIKQVAVKKLAAPEAPPVEERPAVADGGVWTHQYAHEPFTRERASNSVTGLSKGAEVPTATPDATEEALHDPLAGEEARERGIAVHLFMEHFDFSNGAADAKTQLAQVVAGGVMTSAQADQIDLADVSWLVSQSPLAGLLAKARLYREIPMLDSVGLETPAVSELDRVLLRGRLDAIAQTAEGLVVIDYKTDRTFPDPGSEREQAYRRQMELYRNAIKRSGLGQVAGVKLVFLHAREVLEV